MRPAWEALGGTPKGTRETRVLPGKRAGVAVCRTVSQCVALVFYDLGPRK
jgi:hypothetical protein